MLSGVTSRWMKPSAWTEVNSAAEFLDAIENQLVVDVPTVGAPVQPQKKKLNPLMLGGIAAAVVVVLGLGMEFSQLGELGHPVQSVRLDGHAVEVDALQIPQLLHGLHPGPASPTSAPWRG